MKRRILIAVLFLSLVPVVHAQYRVKPNKPFSTLRTVPGWVSINEFKGGIGLHTNSTPNSKQFYGFTTIVGYQLNGNFTAGVGTGFTFYDSNVLVPLFLDFRYSFMDQQLTPYIYADGGLQLLPSDINFSKIFINPGVGARYAFNKKIGATASLGILTQMDGNNRASFLTLKLGGVYVF